MSRPSTPVWLAVLLTASPVLAGDAPVPSSATSPPPEHRTGEIRQGAPERVLLPADGHCHPGSPDADADRHAGNHCFASSDRIRCEASPPRDEPGTPAVAAPAAAPPTDSEVLPGADGSPPRPLPAVVPPCHTTAARSFAATIVRDYSWRWCPSP